MAKYNAGDLIFAKVRGFPPWPARIEHSSLEQELSYPVFFYGTYETATVYVKNIFPYKEFKKVYGKSRNTRVFNLALSEIENTPEIQGPTSTYNDAVPKEYDVRVSLARLNLESCCEIQGGKYILKEKEEAEENIFRRNCEDKENIPENDNKISIEKKPKKQKLESWEGVCESMVKINEQKSVEKKKKLKCKSNVKRNLEPDVNELSDIDGKIKNKLISANISVQATLDAMDELESMFIDTKIIRKNPHLLVTLKECQVSSIASISQKATYLSNRLFVMNLIEGANASEQESEGEMELPP